MPPMIGWNLEMVLDPEQAHFKLARIIDWKTLEEKKEQKIIPTGSELSMGSS